MLRFFIRSILDLAIAIARDLMTRKSLSYVSNLAHDLASASSRACDLARNLVNILAPAGDFTCDLARVGALTRDLALVNAYTRASDLSLDLALASDLALARSLTGAIEIYVILFLFVQRPQGIPPIYEGILLMKQPL